MPHNLDRRRNFVDRLKSAPAIAVGAASAMGLVAYLAKPLTITTGDITGPLVVFGPVINQIRMGSAGGSVIAAFSSVFAGSTYTDNGKWREMCGFNDPAVASVFTTTLDADVPGGRGLRIAGNNGNNFWLNFMPFDSVRPATPAIGDAITWRWYYKIIGGDGDGNYHPTAWGGSTGSPPSSSCGGMVTDSVGALITYEGGGGWNIQIEFWDQGGASTNYETTGAPLADSTWYRHEVTWKRETSNTWTSTLRIWNLAGTQVVGDADVTVEGPSTDRWADATFTKTSSNWATRFTGWGNGVGTVVAGEQDRWAAIVAVSDLVSNIPYPVSGEN